MMQYKVIEDTLSIIGRGVVLILKEYDEDIKLKNQIILYDEDCNIILTTNVKGIETHLKKKMALNISGELERDKNVKYYSIK
jgi:hypothetical protein